MKDITLDNEICNYRSCLESFAFKFTQDVDDANDLVQDTLIKAIRYRHLYENGTNLKAWLYTIMRNTFINDYRKKSVRNGILEVCEELSSAQLRKSADKNLSEDQFVMEDISRALSKLEPQYSVPFLKYFEGFKYHEIAEELQIPIGTVKTRIHVARQELKAQLKMYSNQFKKRRLSV